MTATGAGRLAVQGVTADVIGDLAARHGLRLHALVPAEASLESAYLELTRGSVEYTGAAAHGTDTPVRTIEARRAA